jgi:hypothetical protein
LKTIFKLLIGLGIVSLTAEELPVNQRFLIGLNIDSMGETFGSHSANKETIYHSGWVESIPLKI